jgi:hypothetical protein
MTICGTTPCANGVSVSLPGSPWTNGVGGAVRIKISIPYPDKLH